MITTTSVPGTTSDWQKVITDVTTDINEYGGFLIGHGYPTSSGRDGIIYFDIDSGTFYIFKTKWEIVGKININDIE